MDSIKENSITTTIGSITGIKNIGEKLISKDGRMSLVLEVKEGKQEAKVMAVGEVAERIVGISASELKAMMEADDPKLKAILAAVNGTSEPF